MSQLGVGNRFSGWRRGGDGVYARGGWSGLSGSFVDALVVQFKDTGSIH